MERDRVFLEGESPRVCVDRVCSAFFDGVHTKEDLSLEFQHLTQSQSSVDMVIFDD